MPPQPPSHLRPASATAAAHTHTRRTKPHIRVHDTQQANADQRTAHGYNGGVLLTSQSAMSVSAATGRPDPNGCYPSAAYSSAASSVPTSRQTSARSQRDTPMSMNELHASGSAGATAAAAARPHSDILLDGAIEPCACDQYRSLRCNDKLYSMLHNQISLDSASLKRNQSALALAKAHEAEFAALFGADHEEFRPSKQSDPLKEATRTLHASDFTLGNLKNQHTRVVLPPTIIFSRTRPTEYYFTSSQTGGLKRKSTANTTTQVILDDFLAYAKKPLGLALANLGKRDKEQRAWKMEDEEHTRAIQYGNGIGESHSAKATAGNFPHYMNSIKAHQQGKSPLASSKLSSRHRPSSAFAASSITSMANRRHIQHPLTSSPATPPANQCDIVAQFTFVSDVPRYNDPYLPYTCLTPGSTINTHDFPDILYLNIRSLHHFLTVVNADLKHPRACGVLQPFVRGREERNLVYRASFTAIDATDSGRAAAAAAAAATGASSSSVAPPSFGSLGPDQFHVSMEARQNVLRLVDHTGLAGEFTIAERAATFDAAHVSIAVEHNQNHNRENGGVSARSGGTNSHPSKKHVLYPRIGADDYGDIDLLSPLPSSAAGVPSSLGSTTLVLPSSYPFAPSPTTSAHRVNVPSAMQARIQAAVLRMVAHVNELYRASDRRIAEQRAQQLAIQKSLYTNSSFASKQSLPPPPPLIPPSPTIAVGYMEVFFKVDANDNLILLTCRSLKHIVREPPTPTPTTASDFDSNDHSPPIYVRCAQCYRICRHVPDVLAVQNKMVRPTSAAIERENQPNNGQPRADGYTTPFYARAGVDDDDSAPRRSRPSAVGGRHGRTGSSLVFGTIRRRGDEDGAIDDSQDRDLWPESHFHPPTQPANRFTAVSDRIQSNPLFDDPSKGTGFIRDVDDEDEDDDDDDDEDGDDANPDRPLSPAREDRAVRRAMKELALDARSSLATAASEKSVTAPPPSSTLTSKHARPESACVPPTARSKSSARRPPASKSTSNLRSASSSSRSRPASAASAAMRRAQNMAHEAARQLQAATKQAERERQEEAARAQADANHSHLARRSSLQRDSFANRDLKHYNVHFDDDDDDAARDVDGDVDGDVGDADRRTRQKMAALYPTSRHATNATAGRTHTMQPHEDMYAANEADLSIEIEENQN